MTIIRPLDPTDAADYQRLRLEALQTDPAAFGSSWEEEHTRPLDFVSQRLHTVEDGNFVLGAFDGERLVGTAGFLREARPKTRHKGMVWGVYVAPPHRGKGIARSLMTSLLDRARNQKGLDQIYLSVSVSQSAARSLYASLNFEVYGYEKRALKVGDEYFDEEHLVWWVTMP
jgi:RimJ/RimL family protein N-acetyltransferase